MSEAIRVREPLGERSFCAGEWPVSIGGAGATLVVPGAAAGEVLAHLDSVEGHICLRRVGAQARTVWLQPGTRLELAGATLLAPPAGYPLLELQHDADNRTAPPDIVAVDDGREADPADLPLHRQAFAPHVERSAAPARRARRWLPVTALLVLAVLAVSVFVFGARAIGLRIQTDPQDARLSVEGGGFKPRLAGRYWLLPGNYRLEAVHEGYLPLRQALAITDASPTELHLALTRAPSPVKLDPLPAGSIVYWDERRADANPSTLSAGRHRLRIEAPRHASYAAEVQVRGGGALQVFAPALLAQWAPVTVQSEPAGAQLRVDGRPAGVTPLTLDLDAGLRSLQLDAPNAKGWRGSVLVHGGEAQTVGPVRLAAPDAQLRVNSTPSGADVTVAGQYRGRTPLQMTLPPGLQYEVSVQRAGYEATTQRVDLRSAPQAQVTATLKPVLGEVSVRGEPGDAKVFADGRELGAAGQTFRLPAAALQLEVRKAGFDDFRTTLTPKPADPQVVNFKLLPAGTSAQVALPPVLKNSLGMELRLMPLGEYQMGSNRREPGRRSNEVQRHVVLRRQFYIATQETTNLQFRRFRESHASGLFRSKTLDLDTQPVVNVTWGEAVDFCNWLSAQEGLPPAYVKSGDDWKLATPVGNGYRLPTEAEWEFVARYDGSAPMLRYPWGASLPVTPNSGNYADTAAHFTLEVTMPDYTDGYAVSAPPGKFAPNALGLFDTGGNVSEWVNDWYSAAPPESEAAQMDPIGPDTGKEHVVRGSSFRSASLTELRLAWRDGAADPRPDLGFRVARYAPR